MSFKVVYTRSAFNDIKKLDSVTKKRIQKKIESYSKSPQAYSKRLIDSSLGTYRWRVGNHRIIFDLDGKKIIILRVGHRREIYK